MCFGMLIVPTGVAHDDFLAAIRAFRASRPLTWEVKWHKTSDSMASAYRAYLDVFFDHPQVEFRCLAVDSHQINYPRFHDNDKETAFYNFYYTALAHNMSMTNRYMVFTDERSNRKQNRLSDLKTKLNAHGLERGNDSLVANVEPMPSKKSEELQTVDLLLGAVGYALEGYTTNPGKCSLVGHIEGRLGLPCVGAATLAAHRGRGTGFNTWVFDFSRAKG